MHAQQRQQTHEFLQAKGIAYALFSNPATVTWLTSFAPPVILGNHPFAGGPALVWYEGGQYTLVILDAHAPFAQGFEAQPNCRVVTIEGYTIQQPIASADYLANWLLATLKHVSPNATIALETQHLTAWLYQHLTSHSLVPCDGWLTPFRMIKTDEELTKLKRNFALVDLGQRVAREHCHVGMREIDVWSAVHAAINNEVGFPTALGNDCVVGYRTPNNVGGLPSTHVIQADTALIVDLSTIWSGYWSDSCGTYYPEGGTAQQKTLHRFIQEALDYAISLVKPGVVARELDAKVRQFIADGGYPIYPHHTGHGVGVFPHEAPRIVPYNDEVLQAGMVIMLEPGIYFPGETSVRLEDAVLVTPDGAERLTTFEK